MPRHHLSWYKPGKIVKVNDKMQKMRYVLSEKPGKKFASGFSPDLTPQEMLSLGVFEGKYCCDCIKELPIEWYESAKLSQVADPSVNLFKVKSRMSLQEWRSKGWIIGDDVRGWFQWYMRYWLGRRSPEIDEIQINRWKSFKRHRAQIDKSIKQMRKKDRPKTREEIANHRPKQRQALLQWAYNPF